MTFYTGVCKNCFQVFKLPFRTNCCNACRNSQEDEDVMEDIRQYLKEVPNSSALQISEALNLRLPAVLRFMEEGRLLTVRGSFSRLEDTEE